MDQQRAGEDIHKPALFAGESLIKPDVQPSRLGHGYSLHRYAYHRRMMPTIYWTE